MTRMQFGAAITVLVVNSDLDHFFFFFPYKYIMYFFFFFFAFLPTLALDIHTDNDDCAPGEVFEKN